MNVDETREDRWPATAVQHPPGRTDEMTPEEREVEEYNLWERANSVRTWIVDVAARLLANKEVPPPTEDILEKIGMANPEILRNRRAQMEVYYRQARELDIRDTVETAQLLIHRATAVTRAMEAQGTIARLGDLRPDTMPLNQFLAEFMDSNPAYPEAINGLDLLERAMTLLAEFSEALAEFAVPGPAQSGLVELTRLYEFWVAATGAPVKCRCSEEGEPGPEACPVHGAPEYRQGIHQDREESND